MTFSSLREIESWRETTLKGNYMESSGLVWSGGVRTGSEMNVYDASCQVLKVMHGSQIVECMGFLGGIQAYIYTIRDSTFILQGNSSYHLYYLDLKEDFYYMEVQAKICITYILGNILTVWNSRQHLYYLVSEQEIYYKRFKARFLTRYSKTIFLLIRFEIGSSLQSFRNSLVWRSIASHSNTKGIGATIIYPQLHNASNTLKLDNL